MIYWSRVILDLLFRQKVVNLFIPYVLVKTFQTLRYQNVHFIKRFFLIQNYLKL